MSAAAFLFLYYYSGGGAVSPPTPVVETYPALVDVDLQFLSPYQYLLAEDGTPLLAEDGEPLLSEAPSNTWVSVFTDVRTSAPIVVEYGIKGSTPADRIASSGTMDFSLNNGAWNSAGTLGLYSPLHPDARAGFDLNVPIRLILTQPSQAPYYKFYGRLGNTTVIPGAHAERLVHCTALDLMDDYARVQMPPIAVQFDSDGGTLINRIMQALPDDLQPPLIATQTGLETMPIAFDDIASSDMTIREVMNNVAMSEFGRLVIVGSSAEPGGLLVYSNRHYASMNPSIFCEFTGADIAAGGMVVPGSRDDIINKVQVTAHPTRPLTGFQILYSLENSALLVQNGEVFTGLVGAYRDPLNLASQIGGTNMQQPLVDTFDRRDYSMNTSQDGTGTDLTPFFTVSADFSSGTSAAFTITNNSGTPGYVTKLQVLGQGIYRTDSTIIKTVPGTSFGQNDMQIDMRYQGNLNVVRSVASYLSVTYSRVLARVYSITFLANRNRTWLALAIIGEPNYRIKISEEVTGITDEEFIINGVRLEIVPSARTPLIYCTWYLEPALSQRMWQLGVPGSMELGGNGAVGTAILGF